MTTPAKNLPSITRGGFHWVTCDNDHLLYRDGVCHGIVYHHANEGFVFRAPRVPSGTLLKSGFDSLANAKMGLLVYVAGLVIHRHERELEEIGALVERK